MNFLGFFYCLILINKKGFIMKYLTSKFGVVSTLLVSTLFASNAMAVDFSSLTSAVDFSSAITAILLVFAGLAGVFIAMKGARLIIGALR